MPDCDIEPVVAGKYITLNEIYNEGNIDAYFDSIKTIGNVDDLDITLENMDDTIFSDSKKIVVLKVKNKGIDALNVDIGVDLLFKELN